MGKKKAEQDTRLRVPRGGCRFSSPACASVENRAGYKPGYRCDYLGVRLVRRRSALERLAESLREVSDEQEEG